jgi:hypothetical protein
MNSTSELGKTLAFVGVAAALMGLAIWLNQPLTAGIGVLDEQNRLGEPLFSFKSEDATGIEIVAYDPTTKQVDTLNVDKQGNIWVLPSHENYPSDAENQLGEAAREIRSVKRGSLVGESKSQHEEFGVVDPADAQPGSEGLGMRITVEQGDKKVAQLIIGKEDPGRENSRYVRIVGQDPVYRAQVDVSKFPTDFKQWIEKDVLQLEGFALEDVMYFNYDIDRQAMLAGQMPITNQDLYRLSYDIDKPLEERWTLEELDQAETQRTESYAFKPVDLAGKELDTEKLDALSEALEDLQIIDVRRKPLPLSQALQGIGEGVITQQIAMDLANKGFYFAGGVGLLAQQGNLTVGLKDGIEYELLFGQPAQDGVPTGEAPGRYVFIRVGFNQARIEKPELEPIPTGQAPTFTDESDMPTEPGATAQAAPMLSPEELAQQKAAVEARNALKQAEYQEKIDEGQKRAQELNARFADWYYVVPMDEYEKIHLTRADVIQGAAGDEAAGVPPADDVSIEAFEQLQQPLE